MRLEPDTAAWETAEWREVGFGQVQMAQSGSNSMSVLFKDSFGSSTTKV